MRYSNAYSIEGNYRERVSKWIAVASVALYFIVSEYLASPMEQVALGLCGQSSFAKILIEVASGAISAFFFYSVLWLWFDRYLWKCRVFARWHHIANLNGEWVGTGVSSFTKEDRSCVEYSCQLRVYQAFTKIACVFKTRSSYSNGIVVGLLCSDDLATGCRLNMAYSTKTQSQSSTLVKTWPRNHMGFCSYRVTGDEMVGDYFTDSEPQTKGRIILHRKAI